jgi:hypothetical protein
MNILREAGKTGFFNEPSDKKYSCKILMSRAVLILLFSMVAVSGLKAQETYVPINREMNVRYETYLNSCKSDFHTSVKPYLSKDMNRILNYDSVSGPHVKDNKFNNSLVGRKLRKEHLLQAKGEDFRLNLDPIFEFSGGRDFESDQTIFTNSRGLWFSGYIGERFSFSSSFMESQAKFPNYVDSMIHRSHVVPGGARPKKLYEEFDYNIASGTISYSLKKYFNFQFGIDKNFIGDGYRSLLLSDNAFNYPFFKITTDIWKIKYVNLYTVFQDLDTLRASQDVSFKKKYATFHYLDLDIGRRVNVGFFEAIVWGGDSTRSSGYDIHYLNPIIFFRPVEYSLGSSDNALMGFTLKVKVNSHNLLYGQLLLDEFKLNEVKAGTGWWGNKQAFQVGFKSFNLFTINRLNILGEFNYVRPYTYQHRSSLTNYAHYNQPLAHPLGANFYEVLGILDYNISNFYIMGKMIYAQIGYDQRDSTGQYINSGQNIFLNYLDHYKEYGNYVGQGIKTNLLYTEVQLSYLVNPVTNLRVEGGLVNRMTSNTYGKSNLLLVYLGIRTGLFNRYYDF